MIDYLPFYTKREQLRHSVRPGITGLAQISGRNNLDWDLKLELDVLYVENLFFMNDLKILLKTVYKVISRKDIVLDAGTVHQPLNIFRQYINSESK